MADSLAERLAQIELRMAAACERAGRAPDAVRLLAVSKTQPPEAVEEAFRAGLRQFGESRIPEAEQKIPRLSSQITWHLVGHLQSNKARRAVRLFDVLHSLDSARLADALQAACDQEDRRLSVLLEVNIAGEGQKFGLKPELVAEALARADNWPRLNIAGLMTIPPFHPDPEHARPVFRALRELRARLQDQSGRALPELSMGMSLDFEAAIEEGATWIRVGTDLFGPRPPRQRPEEEE